MEDSKLGAMSPASAWLEPGYGVDSGRYRDSLKVAALDLLCKFGCSES